MVKSFQPSRRQLLNIKKTAYVDLNFSNFFFQIWKLPNWKKKLLSKQKCSLLPVLRDSFGCRYGLTKRLTNCCFNEQSASQCLYDWKSVQLNFFFLLLMSFFRLPKKKDGELKMSWYILTETQSVALPFYLENINH